MKRIVLYDRYKLNEGEMPETRKNKIATYRRSIEENGDILVGSFFDDCSELVPLNDRPAYSKLFEKCKSGTVDEVYVISLSRISRKPTWIFDLCAKMKQLQINVYFVGEGITDEQLIDSDVINTLATAIEQGMGM